MKQKTISPLEDFLSQVMITEMTLYPFLLRLLYNEIYSVVNKGLSQKKGLWLEYLMFLFEIKVTGVCFLLQLTKRSICDLDVLNTELVMA